MRYIAGPVSLLVIVIGILLYKCAGAGEKPSRDFLESEMTAADAEHTGSCFSVDVVLIANFALAGGAVKTWTGHENGNWTYRVEDVASGPGGPVHVWLAVTFAPDGDRVRPVAFESSDRDAPSLESDVQSLLLAPNQRRSTRVERCQKGGVGFQP